MNVLGVTAVALIGIWIGALTLLLVLAIRQIGLLTVRLDHLQSRSDAPLLRDLKGDGLMIGAEVPVEVVTAVPECRSGFAYLLLISSICNPCRELVAEMQRRHFVHADPLIALVPGPPEIADGLIAMLPTKVRAIRDPHAGVLAQEYLQLRSTPFALLIEDGILAGKAYLHSLDDLVRFIDSRATSDAGEVVRRARKTKEVVRHVS